MLTFLIMLHVFGAIIGLGPTFVFPLVGAMAAKEGAPVLWLLRVNHAIEWKLVMPITTVVQPGTGAAIILLYGDERPYLNPFQSDGRWLLISIILYILAYTIALGVQNPIGKRMIEMAERNEFGPQFGALVKKTQMFGITLTVLLVTIIVLMVTKPGSGFAHP